MFGFGKKRVKNATAYLRKGKVYLHSTSTAKAGFDVATPPWLVIDADDVAALDAGLRAALDGSRAKVNTPGRDANILAPIYELAGTKSWRGFIGGTMTVNVMEDGSRLSFQPTENAGKDGVLGQSELDFDAAPGQSPGAALLEAFKLST